MAKIKGQPNWFNLEKVDDFCEKLNKNWYLLAVKSSRGMGKTTWARNRFYENWKQGIPTGFLVTHKDDSSKVIENLEQIKLDFLDFKNVKIKYFPKKFKIIDESTGQLLGHIIPLSIEKKAKSIPFPENEWIYDDIGGIGGTGLSKISKRFFSAVVTANRWRPNAKVYAFFNSEDPFNFLLETFYNNEITKKNGDFYYIEDESTKELAILWDLKPNSFFKEQNIKFSLLGKMAVLFPEYAEMAIDNINFTTPEQIFFKDIKNAKLVYTFEYNNKKYSLYKTDGLFIIAKFKENKKMKHYKITASNHFLKDKIYEWNSRSILRFQNHTIYQNFRNDFALRLF